jgi:hypothetical protein
MDKKFPETVQSETEETAMDVDLTSDPWCNERVYKLFLPSECKHPKYVIACCIDVLMGARTEPDGYKSVIEGGD